ncbi:lysosomal-associated transmembrane protein 4A isoform X1 [Helicoverpa armigera]|uniref:lysosomal-associated transmembrane protein 4A isoform X1 n=1 Tax=Helicoverpa armigera TaxID=29058 RepID=UPI000B3829BD|nr:lysosomal-associated transmembrane protein 4A isoform X1 [Helicoverpa armigera]XP_021185458.1 lysosomal-associated transmembrane protein 4A isoform X1 [Helicoverpa armigera]XP_047030484.1 lysosomal-associated transmembrane protein 4A isoform X1 [Helicoverpa zea]XP_047030485.1 lysosomal-associated transmembrane protein 4A isoform X1 [Helicoverpa zea]XP_047030486.1 lysosomal-associated transmembrane protein 4A isoform X2 [Helicoverpa zea]XP_047030487.1 lysosomal-associated transmembrane prote
MLRFRPKLGSERNSEWRCCFCLHVRTGTILLGTWHLMLHLIALGFLAAIVRDPRLLDELERDSAPMADWGNVARVNEAIPTPLSNVEAPPSSIPQHIGQPRDHSLIYHDVDVGALVTVCTLAITFMLIYGAALGKPAHLLPFFCLQIFDFAITVLTATGYLCYLRSIHRLVAETRRVPWQAQLLQLPAPALALVVLSAFLVAVLLKGYCISVVWRCYKYLTMRAHALQTPFVISSEDVPGAPLPYAAPAPDYSSLLPDYEEAVKQTPPPSYRAATLMAAADPSLTTVQERAQSEQAQPQPQPQPTNTIVVLPQNGTQARV